MQVRDRPGDERIDACRAVHPILQRAFFPPGVDNTAGDGRGWRYTLLVSMRIYELSRAECEQILLRSDVGRLACARENQPYIVPVHFSFDSARACLFAFSTVGQKIDWMRQNPKVCIEVEDVTDKDHWTTVLAFGRYEELDESPADKAARKSAQELFAKRSEWWLPAAAKVGSREHHAVVIYRIQIDRMTGRRASRNRA